MLISSTEGLYMNDSNSSTLGNKTLSTTKLLTTSFSTSNLITFTASSGADIALEFIWWEWNFYSNNTCWQWYGDAGFYWNNGGTWNQRFNNGKAQLGTNNGVGGFTGLYTSALSWFGRRDSYNNRCTVYLTASCNRWDLITITYP
jgi:hypothetical protein